MTSIRRNSRRTQEKKFWKCKIQTTTSLRPVNFLQSTWLIEIIFKNLPKKDFEEEELRAVITKVMAEKLDEKTLKKKKIINKIKVEKEKDRVLADGALRSRVTLKFS